MKLPTNLLSDTCDMLGWDWIDSIAQRVRAAAILGDPMHPDAYVQYQRLNGHDRQVWRRAAWVGHYEGYNK